MTGLFLKNPRRKLRKLVKEKKYDEADKVLSNLIIFLEKNVEEDEGIKDYTQFDGINDDWEEFNERDFSASKGGK